MGNVRFGFTGQSSSLKDLSVGLGHWWYIFIAALGSALISVAASFVGTYCFSGAWNEVSELGHFIMFVVENPYIWLTGGVIAIIYGGRGTYLDQKNLNTQNEDLKKENATVQQLRSNMDSVIEDSESLQNELADLQVKLVTTWLKGSARHLNLNTHCRVTIYYYVKDHFHVLARYSQNPSYNEVHRQKFEKNQGVISKAWEHKVCVDIEGIPLYDKDPDGYKEYMKETYGYELEKIDRLTMKSCQYIALSITEADNHIGVIVFESDKVEHFKTQKVAQIKRYCKDYQSYMVDFINDGIKYDKTLSVSARKRQNVEEEFLSNFGGEI